LDEKHLYVLAQFDLGTDRRLNELYGKLTAQGFIGTQTKGIPYHITLGIFEIEDESEVINRVQAVARATNAFTLRMAYIGLFGLNVVFVAPAVKHDLLDLLQAVVPGGESADEFPWVAHTTLLMDEPEVIQCAIPVVTQHFKPFRARIENIGVYEFFPERKIGVFPLRT
jgi:2'-5' RNA ligase